MDDMEDRLRDFAESRKLSIVRRIGFGIHGQIFAVRGSTPFLTVVKVFETDEAYQRELDVYLRLRDAEILIISGCAVPVFIGSSDVQLTIWMTMVSRPYCLDFAAAYLDELPVGFPPMNAEWLVEKREQFGKEWDRVCEVLAGLESLGIFQTDVTPANISV